MEKKTPVEFLVPCELFLVPARLAASPPLRENFLKLLKIVGLASKRLRGSVLKKRDLSPAQVSENFLSRGPLRAIELALECTDHTQQATSKDEYILAACALDQDHTHFSSQLLVIIRGTGRGSGRVLTYWSGY